MISVQKTSIILPVKRDYRIRKPWKYQPKRDFEIKLNMFKHYAFMPIGKNLRQIMLINENDFLPVRFFAGIKTSYEGEANAAYLCKRFDELGILEVKKDYDTTTK